MDIQTNERGVVLRDPVTAAGIGQFAAIQTVAPMGIELSVAGLQEYGEIERAITEFAGGPNGGLEDQQKVEKVLDFSCIYDIT